MITSSDSYSTIDLGKYYSILPSDGRLLQIYKNSNVSFESVLNGFSYDSGTNPDFLQVDQLRHLIRHYVDSSFQPV